MTGAEIAEILARWAAQGVTGAVEWKDDKRRRLFFFDAGQLVGAQSNLKSESPTRIAERFPALDPEALRIQVALERLRGAFGELEGQVQAHIGATPPARESLDLFALLWAAADALPRPPERSFPRVRSGGAAILAMVPLPDDLREYLGALDGDRDIEDVTSFGPADPETIFNAIALAILLGAVEANEREAATTVVTTQRVADTPVAAATGAAPAAAAAASLRPAASGGDDIGSLIHAELGAAPASDGYEVVVGRPGVAAPTSEEARLRVLQQRIQNAQNHFEVFGLPPTAGVETLRKAYLALAKDLHPDRWGAASTEQRDLASSLFEKARAAWEVLSDDALREKYISRVIRGEKTEEEKAMDRVREILEAEADFKRGVAELNAGRVPGAHEIFTRVVARVADEPEFSAYLGYTTFRLHLGRDEKKAEAGFQAVQEAVKKKEQFDQGFVLLGMMYRAIGDEPKAYAQFVQALKLRPTNPDATRELKRDPTRNPIEHPNAAKERSNSFFSRLFGKK